MLQSLRFSGSNSQSTAASSLRQELLAHSTRYKEAKGQSHIEILQLVESEQEAQKEQEREREQEREQEPNTSDLPLPRCERNWSHWKHVLAADSVKASGLSAVRDHMFKVLSAHKNGQLCAPCCASYTMTNSLPPTPEKWRAWWH